MIGFALVLFWLLTAIMADWVAVFDPYQQIRALQNKPPGAIDPESGLPYLFGGDALGRDVFSRMVYGSRTVMAIAPAGDAVRLHDRHHARAAGGLCRAAGSTRC